MFLRILVMLLLCMTAFAQPSSTEKTTPTDNNSNPVAVPYGWDAASGKYKQLGLGGAIFDFLSVDSLMDIPAEGRGVKLTGTNLGTQGGFVIRNLRSDSAYSVRLVPTTTDPLTILPGTSLFIPYRADCLWVTPISTIPKFEIQIGSVR